MGFAVELEARYEDYDSLKDAVKQDMELFNDFRADYGGEDYSRQTQALINAGDEDINFEAVEHVLDYMHENVGTSKDVSRNVSGDMEGLKAENVEMLVRDLKSKGFAQRYRVSPVTDDQTRIKQISLLRDQDSVQNYAEDSRFEQESQTNADVPFKGQQQSKPPWEKELEGFN